MEASWAQPCFPRLCSQPRSCSLSAQLLSGPVNPFPAGAASPARPCPQGCRAPLPTVPHGAGAELPST